MIRITAVDRQGAEVIIEGQIGETLMQTLREGGGLDIEAICGGWCSCATCHVYIDKAWISQIPTPTDLEAELIEGSLHFRAGESRLSCQITLNDQLDGLRVVLAPED